MKKLALVAILGLTSCSTFDSLADAAGDQVLMVCDRHDALVLGTLKAEDIPELEKRIYLRTTALIRKLIEAIRGGKAQ